ARLFSRIREPPTARNKETADHADGKAVFLFEGVPKLEKPVGRKGLVAILKTGLLHAHASRIEAEIPQPAAGGRGIGAESPAGRIFQRRPYK
ncbi:MAG: hypothetical protein LBT33_11380, partial [Spirochaetia bacterium]|nr:hypothetical protein [Spirochaetia bacterium]